VDGSSLGKPGLLDIGGVLRNHYGILLGIFLLSVGILESNEVEPWVVIKAFEILSKLLRSQPLTFSCITNILLLNLTMLMSLLGWIIQRTDLGYIISFSLQPRDWLYALTQSLSPILVMSLIIWQITWQKEGVRRTSEFVAWIWVRQMFLALLLSIYVCGSQWWWVVFSRFWKFWIL
jgi:hypothetical protein